jgi:soluble lytic murein transglycosylase
MEYTLASYNAGKGRVDNWRNWFDFREPAEFVESIPIDETRNYVQIVMRNADFYRRLYAGRPGVSTPAPFVAAAAPPPPATKASAKKVPSKNANSGRKTPARAATGAASSRGRTPQK